MAVTERLPPCSDGLYLGMGDGVGGDLWTVENIYSLMVLINQITLGAWGGGGGGGGGSCKNAKKKEAGA